MPRTFTKCRVHSERRHGAVFVEALIVIGLLLVFVQSIWFMARVYTAKQRATLEARTGAWLLALNGCDEDNFMELYDSVHERSKSGDTLCEGDCPDGEVAGLSKDGAPPSWFDIEAGSPGSSSYPVVDSLFVSREMGATREFACNPKQNRRELHVGNWAGELISAVKRIFTEEAEPPTKPKERCKKHILNPLSWFMDCKWEW